MALVDDHADVLRVSRPLGHSLDGLRDEVFELRDARPGDAGLTCERLELAPMIEGEHVQLFAWCARRRRAVHVPQTVVEVGTTQRRRSRQVVLELDPARHRGRTAMAAHDQRAAGVAHRCSIGKRLPVEQAREQPGKKCVSGAQHVHDFNRESTDGLFLAGGFRRLIEHDAALGAAFHHDGAAGRPPDRRERIAGAIAAACDVDLLFGADH